MRNSGPGAPRILAITAFRSGLGFVVLEGKDQLIDWGVKAARGQKNKECIKKVARLIDCYLPDALIVEDCRRTSRRCTRVQQLIEDIAGFALQHRIKCHRVSRANVNRLFYKSGAVTKYQIALAIANRLPELSERLPRPRKPWMSEDERMSIFDAAALAVAFRSL